MSGHSKWATIKHKKGALDAQRGKMFTKLIRELTTAARSGGGDPKTNPRLRTAIDRAKGQNMPSDNIDKAIKKGTGELPGVSYEEVSFEGYGPAGVAIYVEGLSDNKNRTSSEIRNIFSKKNGNMAGAGSVAWIFEKKGFFSVKKDVIGEDKLMNVALEAGAEDFTVEDEYFEITTAPQDYDTIKQALEQNGIKPENAELTMLPKSTVKIADAVAAKQVLGLIEALEEHDDIQNVYANFDIPNDVMDEVSAS